MRPAILLPDRLAFAPEAAEVPRGATALSIRDIDEEEFRDGRFEVAHYNPKDLRGAFGPLGLDQTVAFVLHLARRMRDRGAFVVVQHSNPQERQNVAVLVGAYLILMQAWSAEQVSRALPEESRMMFPTPWMGDRDLRETRMTPQMLVGDCWEGFELARRHGWLRRRLLEDEVAASLSASKFLRTLKEYDGSWLVPHKVFVMADPTTTVHDPNPDTFDTFFPAGDAAAPPAELEEELVCPGTPQHSEVGTPRGKGGNDEGGTRTGSTAATTPPQPECEDLDNISVHSVCKQFTRGIQSDALGVQRRMSTTAPLLDFFKESDIVAMVRVNHSDEPGLREIGGSYRAEVLEQFGVSHVDLPIHDTDGAVPRPRAIYLMLESADELGFRAMGTGPEFSPRADRVAFVANPHKAIAIHCKSGFGRSVVFACLLVIHMYDVPGKALLGWSRIVRPGAVCTPQQEAFLRSIRGRGDLHRRCGWETGVVEELPGANVKCCAVQ